MMRVAIVMVMSIHIKKSLFETEILLDEPELFANYEVGIRHENYGHDEQNNEQENAVEELDLEERPLFEAYGIGHLVRTTRVDHLAFELEDDEKWRHYEHGNEPYADDDELHFAVCADRFHFDWLTDYEVAVDAYGCQCHH